MDTTALSNIVHAILLAVVEKDLVDCITAELDNNGSVEDGVKEGLRKAKLSFKRVESSTPNSSNKPDSKPKTSTAAKKGALLDEHGAVRKCSAMKKSDNSPCKFDAKEEHKGKYYCGTHIKGATSDKPVKDKKPKFSNDGHKSSASVEEALLEVDNSIELDL